MMFIYLWLAVIVGFVFGCWWKSKFLINERDDRYHEWRE